MGDVPEFDLVGNVRPLADSPWEDLDNVPPKPIPAYASMGEFKGNQVDTNVLSDGSGAVVGPRHVLTAADVLFDAVQSLPYFDENCQGGWTAEFTPAKGPDTSFPVEVICAIYDQRYILETAGGGWAIRDVQYADLALAILMDNEATANAHYYGIWVGLGADFYEERPLGVFGYPGAGFMPSQSYVTWGGFRGFDGQDLATYGTQTTNGMSGGRVAAAGGDLNDPVGLHEISFVHGGRYESEDATTRVGVRFNEFKAEEIKAIICNTPGALVDLEGCP